MEAGFAHKAELGFYAVVLRNRRLGAWVAQQLGLEAEAALRYVEALVEKSVSDPSPDSVFKKIRADLDSYQVECTDRSLRRQMETLLQEAHDEIHKN